ncbi:hypothetical protein [Tenacibaculum agarivorans]|uniref:hypothetical protein n=1 Tax=Tenacibaculum agarivorans TaxID=1908389 RepID=UPI000ABA0C65|nr:hypothetical protein [Tenacibaculum agarivorans]
MNKNACVLLVFSTFFCLIVNGQFDVSVSSLSGYEKNINRITDRFLNDENELLTSESLHQNSFYQDVGIEVKYTKRFRRSKFKVVFSPENRFYVMESSSNRLLINSKLFYTYDFSRKTQWKNNIQYKIRDQKGLDADANELSATFGYNLLNINSGLHFRLYKSNRSFITINYARKKFDPTETRRLSYNKYRINVGFKEIKRKRRLLRSYGFTLGFSNREYSIENHVDEENTTRTWNYVDLSAFYKIQFHEKLMLNSRLLYESRIDKTNAQFGYQQIKPALTLQYTSTKFMAKLVNSYTYRQFKSLRVNTNELLRYDYFRSRVEVNYMLSKKLSLLGEFSLIDRRSNNLDISATAFRSYHTNYVGVGLKYSF